MDCQVLENPQLQLLRLLQLIHVTQEGDPLLEWLSESNPHRSFGLVFTKLPFYVTWGTGCYLCLGSYQPCK